MTTCPYCNGEKQHFALVDTDRGGYSALLACRVCRGTGEVSEDTAAAIAAGRERRRGRIARGLSLREEAARLGITPSALSKIERGEIERGEMEPDELPAVGGTPDAPRPGKETTL